MIETYETRRAGIDAARFVDAAVAAGADENAAIDLVTYGVTCPSDFAESDGRQVVSYNADENSTWIRTPIGQHRDSMLLDQSNFATAIEMLREIDEDAVDVAGASHWAVGWSECVIVDGTSGRVVAEVCAILAALADYPVLDDVDYSRRETEAFGEYLPTAWRDEIRFGPNGPESDVVVDALDAIDPGSLVAFLEYQYADPDIDYGPPLLEILADCLNSALHAPMVGQLDLDGEPHAIVPYSRESVGRDIVDEIGTEVARAILAEIERK